MPKHVVPDPASLDGGVIRHFARSSLSFTRSEVRAQPDLYVLACVLPLPSNKCLSNTAFRSCSSFGRSPVSLPLCRSSVRPLPPIKHCGTVFLQHVYLQGVPSGRRPHFDDFNLVVAMSAQFCLGSCKSGRMGRACWNCQFNFNK